MISVVISTYKRPEKLKRAISSVINQSYQDFEVIVVNDGDEGIDAVNRVCLDFEDKRIKLHPPIEHFGNDTKPKNKGILEARGEYIAFLDDDNEYRPDHLQALLRAIEGTDLDVVYGDRWIVDDSGKIKPQIGVFSEFSLSVLLQRNFIDTSDVLVKRESLLKVGGFDERYKKYVDWNLWVRMGKFGMKFKHVPLVITDYHLHEGMKSLTVKDRAPDGGPSVPLGSAPVFIPEWDPFDVEICLPYLGQIPPEPKVAIYTLTYERVELTKRMYQSLLENAEYPFDWFVVDQGSKDGTIEWLVKEAKPKTLIQNKENKGISMGSNQALDAIGSGYDIIVKIDNDITFDTKGFLAKMVEVWKSIRLLALSPYPQGLKDNPGGAMRIGYGTIKGEFVGMTKHLGGACVFVDASAYKDFRWDSQDFLHSIQDVEFSRYIINQGFQMGYLENYFFTHDTGKQKEEYKEYFDRRTKEKTTRYEESK